MELTFLFRPSWRNPQSSYFGKWLSGLNHCGWGFPILHPISVLVTRHRSEESLTEKGSSDSCSLFGNDPTALYSTLDGVHTFITITLEHTQPWIVELRSTSSFDDIQLPNISTWSPRPIDSGPLCSVHSYWVDSVTGFSPVQIISPEVFRITPYMEDIAPTVLRTVQRKWIDILRAINFQYSTRHQHPPKPTPYTSYHGWILSQRLPSFFSLRSPAYTGPRVSTWSPPLAGLVIWQADLTAWPASWYIILYRNNWLVCIEMIDPTVILQLFVAYYIQYSVQDTLCHVKYPWIPYTVRVFWPKSNGGQLRWGSLQYYLRSRYNQSCRTEIKKLELQLQTDFLVP